MKKIEFEGITDSRNPNETVMLIKRTDVQPIEATSWKSNKILRKMIINFINTPKGKEYINRHQGIPIKEIEKPTYPEPDAPIIGRVIKIYETHALIALKNNCTKIPTAEDIANKLVLCIDGRGHFHPDGTPDDISSIHARLATRVEECNKMLEHHNYDNNVKCGRCCDRCKSEQQTLPGDFTPNVSKTNADEKHWRNYAVINALNDNEVFAHGFNTGDQVRIYGHHNGISYTCTVNNETSMGIPLDHVGINPALVRTLCLDTDGDRVFIELVQEAQNESPDDDEEEEVDECEVNEVDEENKNVTYPSSSERFLKRCRIADILGVWEIYFAGFDTGDRVKITNNRLCTTLVCTVNNEIQINEDTSKNDTVYVNSTLAQMLALDLESDDRVFIELIQNSVKLPDPTLKDFLVSDTYILEAEIRNLYGYEVVIPGFDPKDRVDVFATSRLAPVNRISDTAIDNPKPGKIYMSQHLYTFLGLNEEHKSVTVSRRGPRIGH